MPLYRLLVTSDNWSISGDDHADHGNADDRADSGAALPLQDDIFSFLESPADVSAEEREQLRRDTAGFWIGQSRQQLGVATPYTSRMPCSRCETTEALLYLKGGQNIVICASCGLHLYNAPKSETGEVQRTVETLRRQIKPSQQARILDRDHGRCLLCGTADNLTIGHLLSIEDGLRLGVLGSELNDDANLAAMCEACNLGLGHRSVSLRTYIVLMSRLLQAEVARAPARRQSR